MPSRACGDNSPTLMLWTAVSMPERSPASSHCQMNSLVRRWASGLPRTRAVVMRASSASSSVLSTARFTSPICTASGMSTCRPVISRSITFLRLTPRISAITAGDGVMPWCTSG